MPAPSPAVGPERVAQPGTPAPAAPAPPNTPPDTRPEPRRMEVCPASYGEFPSDGPPLGCGCTAEAATPGRSSVFGDGV